MAYAPPMKYSHVTGITSPTGDEAEGWLITVGGTPKELMAHSPEFTYARLLAAAETRQEARRPDHGPRCVHQGRRRRRRHGGQAGVRCRSRPATATAPRVPCGRRTRRCERLGLAEFDEQGRIKGKAMVVGATGAIGSVCARLLALASDELWLVSPETAKLLALKARHRAGEPARRRSTSRPRPTRHLPEMDMIVTATSGAGKRVLDIMAVKPGCVITDVARPLDLSAEDVAKRPDVLVIESGEIELPGDVQMRDIGLPTRRGLRLPGRDDRAGPRGPLRDLHGRAQHRVGEGQGDLPDSASSTA